MFRGSLFVGKEEKWADFETEAMPHMNSLFRNAMWLTRDRDLAEDLVQDTMFEAIRSFHRYELGTNCKAWLTRIMHNLNSKRIYKLGRMRVVDDPEDKLAETIPFEPSIPETLTDEEVITAIRKVPDPFRDVILLADVEEFSYKDIAFVLGVPIGTVMSRLYRGRRVLRQELTEYARNYGFGTEGRQIAG